MPPNPDADNLRLLAMRRVQLVEEFLARLQIGGAKSFGKPVIDRLQYCHRVGGAALIT
jgi:hypothetical protein